MDIDNLWLENESLKDELQKTRAALTEIWGQSEQMENILKLRVVEVQNSKVMELETEKERLRTHEYLNRRQQREIHWLEKELGDKLRLLDEEKKTSVRLAIRCAYLEELLQKERAAPVQKERGEMVQKERGDHERRSNLSVEAPEFLPSSHFSIETKEYVPSATRELVPLANREFTPFTTSQDIVPSPRSDLVPATIQGIVPAVMTEPRQVSEGTVGTTKEGGARMAEHCWHCTPTHLLARPPSTCWLNQQSPTSVDQTRLGAVQRRPQAKSSGQSSSLAPGLESDSCSICLEALSPGPLGVLACGHQFHRGCIDNWLARSRGGQATCPLCRQHV